MNQYTTSGAGAGRKRRASARPASASCSCTTRWPQIVQGAAGEDRRAVRRHGLRDRRDVAGQGRPERRERAAVVRLGAHRRGAGAGGAGRRSYQMPVEPERAGAGPGAEARRDQADRLRLREVRPVGRAQPAHRALGAGSRAPCRSSAAGGTHGPAGDRAARRSSSARSPSGTARCAPSNAVSFTIEPGTLVTLLGPSGCGKTTTLRLIAGLEIASEGQILIGGRDVTRLSAADRERQHGVPVLRAVSAHDGAGERRLRPDRAGRARRRRRTPWPGRSSRSSAWPGSRAGSPSELSGGQQQRVAVARALVLEPQVLLFDEPLSNLDAKLRRRVREEIRELQQKLNLTVAYVTHDQEEALAVSDRIIVMANAPHRPGRARRASCTRRRRTSSSPTSSATPTWSPPS